MTSGVYLKELGIGLLAGGAISAFIIYSERIQKVAYVPRRKSSIIVLYRGFRKDVLVETRDGKYFSKESYLEKLNPEKKESEKNVIEEIVNKNE